MIETHVGAEYAVIVTDETGQNKVVDELQIAEPEAADCQDGIVVELYTVRRPRDAGPFSPLILQYVLLSVGAK